jgi:hypothetical protein
MVENAVELSRGFTASHGRCFRSSVVVVEEELLVLAAMKKVVEKEGDWSSVDQQLPRALAYTVSPAVNINAPGSIANIVYVVARSVLAE